MDDVTDTVFRQVVTSCAPADVYFTEFVNVDGLQSAGRPNLLKKLQFVPSETSLIAQLWGKDPENFRKTAEQIADGTFQRELGLPSCPVHHSSSSSAFYRRGTDQAVLEYGAVSTAGEKRAGAEKASGVSGYARKQDGRCVCGFIGIDLNMGCPAKSEVKNGTCSALMQNRPLAAEIIAATKAGVESTGSQMPISVKTRLGWSDVDHTWSEFLLNQKLNMLTIHGRTKKEMSKVPAHWDEIGKVRELRDQLSPDTLIVGNGDVTDRRHGLELAKKYGLDGIMIGRGVFQDPYVFADQSPWESMTREEKLALYERHVTLFAQTWQNNERPIHTLNKFCKIYINGFDGAKELREQLMAADSTELLLKILNDA